MKELELVLETARKAVARSTQALLAHYRSGVAVERKADRSPVTVADRESERAIVEVIRAAFPTHAILGEEGGTQGEGPKRWIVDPLDGTRGFCRGGEFWGPLVAYEENGEILAGAMALPVSGQTYWAARGLGAWRDGVRLLVSGVDRWENATLSLGQLPGLLSPPLREGVLELVHSADSARCVGDLAGCAMLLDGKADAWLEAGVQVWDLAPLKILVEEAGGRFTDMHGKPTVHSGEAIATNGKLHEYVRQALRSV